MNNLPYKILIVTVVIMAGAVLVIAAGSNKTQNPPVPAFAEVISTPSPTPPSTTTILAPDGKMNLLVKEEKKSDGVEKTFSIAPQGKASTEIYSKTEPAGSSLSVPYNTFSPDDRYIFLKETTPLQNYYYVLATSGEPIVKDLRAVEVTSLFYAKYSEFKITDITGWGGMTLLVINTDKSDGSVGPSFWFDVVSRSFIRLSVRFN